MADNKIHLVFWAFFFFEIIREYVKNVSTTEQRRQTKTTTTFKYLRKVLYMIVSLQILATLRNQLIFHNSIWSQREILGANHSLLWSSENPFMYKLGTLNEASSHIARQLWVTKYAVNPCIWNIMLCLQIHAWELQAWVAWKHSYFKWNT